MPKSLQVATLLFALTVLNGSIAAAQSPGVNVAVIDINHIFKNNPRFTAEADQIKAEIKQFEEFIEGKRANLMDQRKKLDTFKPGSPEYKQVEENLARMTSDLQVQASLKRKEVLEKEAKLYHNTYGQIQLAIKQVATKYNIGLVLRYNSKPIDPNDRNDVLNGINRPVVFQNGIDITQPVMDVLAPRQATRPGQTR